MLICPSRTKISIGAVAFDQSTAFTLTRHQSPRDKQEKGEGRNTTQMILRSPFSCSSLRRDRRVTVKDVDLCEPHHNLDSCGRVRSINGVHTHAGINRPRDKQEKGEGRNTTQMILSSPFSCDLLRRDRRVTVKAVDLWSRTTI